VLTAARTANEEASIGDEDIEAVADDATHLGGQRVRVIGGGDIGPHRVGAAAGGADLLDHGVGLGCRIAVGGERPHGTPLCGRPVIRSALANWRNQDLIEPIG
jgi:hypothetical protein